ncbi:uncharacterized protein LOC130694082 [Daphnia carinata]|uniref:uncharacterized protein LOC130694082 n=1 Tax=Daphnia carinata TaxID=120202 RepID=UPI00257C5D01|nr:uncharacterized protein LOC130694082 [Daphnia carinata]
MMDRGTVHTVSWYLPTVIKPHKHNGDVRNQRKPICWILCIFFCLVQWNKEKGRLFPGYTRTSNDRASKMATTLTTTCLSLYVLIFYVCSFLSAASVNGIWDKSGGYKTSLGTLNNPVLIYISTPDNHLGDKSESFNQIDYQALLSEAALSQLPLPQTTVPPPLELKPTHINFLVRLFRSFSAIPAIFRPRRLRCHMSPTVALFDDLNCFMSLKKRIKT